MSPRPASPFEQWQEQWQAQRQAQRQAQHQGRPQRSDAQLRIGDAEREQAASALAEHYAVGRLDHDEHAERLDRVWAARTRAELAPVFADLPGPLPGAAAPPPRPGSPRPGGVRPRRPRIPGPLLVLLVLLGVVAVVTHLPLVLIGLGVWFFFLRGGCGGHRGATHPRRW